MDLNAVYTKDYLAAPAAPFLKRGQQHDGR